ncbi:MAG: hypothetical protein EVB11_06480 [Winogradskyella sp.]|nr:MAG: hypothetical protein EVB11_06480 [Winogradskyella sp.]
MKHYTTTLLFMLSISISLAQELNVPDTYFPEPEDPLHFVFEKYGLNRLDNLNGNIKTITITQNSNFGDDKYYQYTKTHHFNSNKKRTISTYHTIVHDCCGEELENKLDTIYPNKKLKITKINNHIIETINANEGDLKTKYHMSNGKLTHTITKDNETYFRYSEMDNRISREGYHLVKGYRGEDGEEEYTRYKYNSFIENGYYNAIGQLNKVKKVFYEHYFDTYGENKTTYVYNNKGQLSQRTEKSATYLVKNFDPTKAILDQEWVGKTIEEQSFLTYTFDYDYKDRLKTYSLSDEISTSHYKISYAKESIKIEYVAFVGTKKEILIEKHIISLDAKGNPTSLKMTSLNVDNQWIENKIDELKITYQYYNN